MCDNSSVQLLSLLIAVGKHRKVWNRFDFNPVFQHKNCFYFQYLGTKQRKIIGCLFISLTIIRVILLSLSLMISNRSIFNIISHILYNFMLKPTTESFLFLSLSFSYSISQYYRDLRLSLNNGMTSEKLIKIRQSFVKTRKIITEFDRSMTMVLPIN